MKMDSIQIPHHERTVFGQRVLPDGEGTYPMVIFSHGYNGFREDFVSTAKWLAEQGIGSFCYTFCGGSVRDESKYPTTNMTIFSEKEDLLAVFDVVRNWESTDSHQIFLFGGSQGGLVTALATEERKEQVRGMILLYPALCIADDWRKRFPKKSDIPDELELWGMKLGRVFFESIRDFRLLEQIGGYTGPVLIFHGDQDPVVPVEYSKKVQTVYQNVQMEVFEGEGHGFSAQGTKKMERYLLEFLQTQIK